MQRLGLSLVCSMPSVHLAPMSNAEHQNKNFLFLDIADKAVIFDAIFLEPRQIGA